MTDDKQKSSLSKEQVDRAIVWLREKSKGGKQVCEVCGNDDWLILDSIVAPANIIRHQYTIGGDVVPQFMTMCTNCANTKYFNAIMSGVFEKKKEEDLKDE